MKSTFDTRLLQPGDLIYHENAFEAFLILDVGQEKYEWYRFRHNIRKTGYHSVIEQHVIHVYRDGERLFP